MDKKEQQIMNHYKAIIESNKFDEYDILGFLIFIRRHLDSGKYPYIKEFAHLVAHRERDRGIVNDCIVNAIKNNYQTEKNSNEISGYKGMNYSDWVKEWKALGTKLGITFNNKILEDITLCVFSLAQFTIYKDDKGGGSGKLELFISAEGNLMLATTEGNSDSLYICYSGFGNYNPCRYIPAGKLKNPVETVRINETLRLKDSEGFII